MDKIVEKLQNFLEGYAELARTKPGVSEHAVLIQKIQLSTSEYLSLMNAYQVAKKSRLTPDEKCQQSNKG